mmetsp:Transcript_8898/g.29453  ORF Transcript_8898/g.29453 Transcript_8898/m.29453 type:complete len:254 (-) Transcript_8898:1073-1834(-)
MISGADRPVAAGLPPEASAAPVLSGDLSTTAANTAGRTTAATSSPWPIPSADAVDTGEVLSRGGAAGSGAGGGGATLPVAGGGGAGVGGGGSGSSCGKGGGAAATTGGGDGGGGFSWGCPGFTACGSGGIAAGFGAAGRCGVFSSSGSSTSPIISPSKKVVVPKMPLPMKFLRWLSAGSDLSSRPPSSAPIETNAARRGRAARCVSSRGAVCDANPLTAPADSASSVTAIKAAIPDAMPRVDEGPLVHRTGKC